MFVGKTTIAGAMMKVKSTEEYNPTIGAAMVKIPYVHENRPVKWFYFWDTGGMEKFRALAPVYYRDSSAALVVYDVTKRQTFERVDSWVRLYRDSCSDANPVIVIGNKIDLDKREVDASEGEQYAAQNKCQFMEVSARTGDGISKILAELDTLLEEAARGVPPPTRLADKTKQNCCR
jgi:small GTP-binding protein